MNVMAPEQEMDWKALEAAMDWNKVRTEELAKMSLEYELARDYFWLAEDDGGIIEVLQQWAHIHMVGAGVSSDPSFVPWTLELEMNGETCKFDFPSLEVAKEAAMATLEHWRFLALNKWSDEYEPTDEELNNYNDMIRNYSTRVIRADSDTCEYATAWAPSWDYPIGPDYHGGGVVLPPRTYKEALNWTELDRKQLEWDKYCIENEVVF